MDTHQPIGIEHQRTWEPQGVGGRGGFYFDRVDAHDLKGLVGKSYRIGTIGDDFDAGSAASGVVLSVHSRNGGVTVSNVYAADAPNQLTIVTDNGTVAASGINGGAKVRTENGEATGSITPRKGSIVEVSSGNGDVALSLPTDFAADKLTLHGKKVTVTGFGDLSGTSTSRGAAGTGAASVTASCDNLGDVTVKPQ